MNMNSDLKQLVMAVSLGCMGASPAFAGTNSLAVSHAADLYLYRCGC